MFGLGFTRLFWFSRGIRHQVHFKKNVFGSDIYYQMLNNVLFVFFHYGHAVLDPELFYPGRWPGAVSNPNMSFRISF